METFLNTSSVNFDSIVGKYICFIGRDSKNLLMTHGTYHTNCNYIYYVTKVTSSYIFVDSDFHGLIDKTRMKRDTFERDFLNGMYVISDTKPVDGQKLGTYSIRVPNYSFSSDTSKSFTTDEINELLQSEFMGTTKTPEDIRECLETLCNIIMKRHFDYVSIGRSYCQDGNSSHIGLNIKTGCKYLGFFGIVNYRYYRNKVVSISFTPVHHERTWTTMEDLIVWYLMDNKDYIDNL
jgi:hypothetical protein